MSARLVGCCGLCGSGDLETVLDLGSSPPTCNMARVGHRRATEHHHPLTLLKCEDCTLVQLSVVVDPATVFPDDYPYSSGNSPQLHRNFEDLADRFPVGPEDLVVDVGANDGTLLHKFQERYGCRTVGVEPTRQVVGINGPAWSDRFRPAVAEAIRRQYGPAKLITATNVLAHVEHLDSVMTGIHTLLADDGVLVAENHDLASIVAGQWDAVYHEHLRFFDPASFDALLERHDFLAGGWEPVSTHGGSFRMWTGNGDFEPPVRDYDFAALRAKTAATRNYLRTAVLEAWGDAWGIGATARATTVINYCGLDVEDMPAICEVAGSDKIGRYIPGTRIPVVDEAELFRERPPLAVLFSWHLADTVVPKLREKGYDGEIVVPLPVAEVLA